jgi:polyhydroxybutyrate depolymerase
MRNRAAAAAFVSILGFLSAAVGFAQNRELHLSSGGLDRKYLLHAPAKSSRAAMPLLVVLHGGGGTAEGMVRLTKGRFDELADRDGFYVVYPQGVGNSWNDGRRDIRSKAREQNVDDVGFFRALVAHLASTHEIDRSRVFVTGMSNGGMMSLRIGCSLPEVFRGVAAVAASLPEDVVPFCSGRPAGTLLLFDGTADPIVPYSGGGVRVLWSDRGRVIGAEKTAALWAEREGCRGAPASSKLPSTVPDGTRVSRLDYPACPGGGVTLFRIAGGGHAWPGGRPYLTEGLIGKTSRNLSTCDAIWECFSKIAPGR